MQYQIQQENTKDAAMLCAVPALLALPVSTSSGTLPQEYDITGSTVIPVEKAANLKSELEKIIDDMADLA